MTYKAMFICKNKSVGSVKCATQGMYVHREFWITSHIQHLLSLTREQGLSNRLIA
jgi:hypothetical protein